MHLLLGQCKAQMIGRVAGCEQRFKCPVRASTVSPSRSDDVGLEAGVDVLGAFGIDEGALVAGVAAIAADLGVGRICHAIQTVDVVAVGVRDDDVADRAAGDVGHDGCVKWASSSGPGSMMARSSVPMM